MPAAIDLNADLAEEVGDDVAMLGVVTSANLCCGAHAGGRDTLRAAIAVAQARGVVIGAHPGYEDRANFGRIVVPMALHEITQMVARQVANTLEIADEAGAKVAYVKPHGALYNLASEKPEVAMAIAAGVAATDRDLVLLGLAGSVMLTAGSAAGLRVAAEAFADRAYLPNGRLVPRAEPGAVLHDAGTVATRAVAMVLEAAVLAVDGSRVPLAFDSLCLHGDTPGSVAMARAIKAGLQAKGVMLRGFAG
jgi:5-oxoprolinase (ATP-hydrolysing) subunit A